MRLSTEIIKKYCPYEASVKDIAQVLTLSGTKVESIELEGEGISKVLSGKIIEVEKHPNADKLRVLKVDCQKAVLQIVTGATNVQLGDIVPVALVGARLSQGVKIKKSKLRSVESEGMLCSLEELGIDSIYYPKAPEDGVYVFAPATPLGKDALELLGYNQEILDFEITSNRPDCLSAVGIARELAASLGLGFKYEQEKLRPDLKQASSELVDLELSEPDLCPLFSSLVIKDVKVGPSPAYLRRYLRAFGLRPVNNIVDITNYVMLILGQPLHAYDLAKLAGQKLCIRRAKAGEKFISLAEDELVLDQSDLVIADAKSVVGLAGVIGGQNSEIDENTKDLVLEAANFDSTSVLLSARKHNLRTDASMRFEKGLGLKTVKQALLLAARLIQEEAGGKVALDIYSQGKEVKEPLLIKFEIKEINQLLGLDLSEKEIRLLLKRLEIETAEDGDNLLAVVPDFRSDLFCAADLAEEVARLYDYNNIPANPAGANFVTTGSLGKLAAKRLKIKHSLIAAGAYELCTYNFVSEKDFAPLNLRANHPWQKRLSLNNPLGEDYAELRNTLVPSVLKVVANNNRHQIFEGLVFEMGQVALYQEDLATIPLQPERLCLAAFQAKSQKTKDAYYQLKSVLDLIFKALAIQNVSYQRGSLQDFLHPGQEAEIFLGAKSLGFIGSLHPKVAKELGITSPLAIAELDLEYILKELKTEFKFTELNRYPAVSLDLALVCSQDVLSGDLIQEIKAEAGPYLDSIELFDVFTGPGLKAEEKSLAFHLFYKSATGTLTDEIVKAEFDRLLSHLKAKGYSLR